MTLNDSKFTNLVKVSDTFAGGVSASRSGSVITLNVPAFYFLTSLTPATPTLTATFNVVTPAAVPEPDSIALLAGMGLSGAGFLVRRRKTARKSA